MAVPLTPMLRTTGSSKVLTLTAVRVHDDKVICGGHKSNKNYLSPETLRSSLKVKDSEQSNFLSSNASKVLFNLSLDTKLMMVSSWLLLKLLRSNGVI